MKLLYLLTLSYVAWAELLVNYTGGQPASVLGFPQLEGQNLGDRFDCCPNVSCFIEPCLDFSGRPALHFHRAPHFRRAEVEISNDTHHGPWKANQTYYIEYELQITNERNALVLFQWKRDDKTVAPKSNIPFHLAFGASQLNLQVTTPGGSGSNIFTVASTPFSINSTHNVRLTFDTTIEYGQTVSQNNRLAFWLDGTKVHDGEGYSLWSTKTQTYPKVGIYRGEYDGTYTEHADDPAYTFDSYVYGVQISDSGFGEARKSDGIVAKPTDSMTGDLLFQGELRK